MSDWFEIAIAAGPAIADDLAAMLMSELGDAAAGVEQRSDEVVFWVRPERSEPALEAVRAALTRLRAAGLPVDPAAALLRPAVPEVEWRDAWKRYFKVIHLTRQIVVVPSWEQHTPGPGDLEVHLDPGQAFGTGAHASTRLVLEELQRLADEGARPRRMLDVGTGSGILTIAAGRFWPGIELVATDNDPLAVDTALENLAKNQITARATSDGLDALEGQFDIVVANIQADVLDLLAPALVARLGPGATLVLSGLLSPQTEEIAARYRGLGLALVAIRPSELDPQWSAVRLGAR